VGTLVGAGSGLTPSGDDVLCGVLLGLRMLGRARDLPRLWDTVAPRLSTTTTLSAALLVEAVQGYAVPPVIDLGEALVDDDAVGVPAAAARTSPSSRCPASTPPPRHSMRSTRACR
jgi:hypothetical protein